MQFNETAVFEISREAAFIDEISQKCTFSGQTLWLGGDVDIPWSRIYMYEIFVYVVSTVPHRGRSFSADSTPLIDTVHCFSMRRLADAKQHTSTASVASVNIGLPFDALTNHVSKPAS